MENHSEIVKDLDGAGEVCEQSRIFDLSRSAGESRFGEMLTCIILRASLYDIHSLQDSLANPSSESSNKSEREVSTSPPQREFPQPALAL